MATSNIKLVSVTFMCKYGVSETLNNEEIVFKSLKKNIIIADFWNGNRHIS